MKKLEHISNLWCLNQKTATQVSLETFRLTTIMRKRGSFENKSPTKWFKWQLSTYLCKIANRQSIWPRVNFWYKSGGAHLIHRGRGRIRSAKISAKTLTSRSLASSCMTLWSYTIVKRDERNHMCHGASNLYSTCL